MAILHHQFLAVYFALSAPVSINCSPFTSPDFHRNFLTARAINISAAQPGYCPLAGTGGDPWTDCCQLQGKSWQYCSGQWPNVVNCYSLDDHVECCSDGSVCDIGLGCCGKTCCTSDTSTTICKGGSICHDGVGCCGDSCCHGKQASQSQSTTSANSPDSTSSHGSGVSPGQTDPGFSRSDKIALGCGIGIGLPATLATLWMCILVRPQKKRSRR